MSRNSSHPLDPLINPQSIALIGASARVDTSGRTLFDMVSIDGYQGRVYLVNPRYEEIDGQPCYPSLEALPETVEHAAIALNNSLLERTLDQVINHGARAATIFASCLSEVDTKPALAEVIREKARGAGLMLCGGNSMGLYNNIAGFRLASFGSRIPLRKGGVAWIVQSGSAISAIAHGERRVGLSLCVSTGMELTTTVAEYADWALSQPSVRVIGMFLESVRNPEAFIRMLDRAREQRVPVVILKVGRSEKGAAMAKSHTGAIVGDNTAFDALCDRYGVIRVRDFNEMIATLQLLDRDIPVLQGDLVTMHDSGGEREMLADLSEDLGVSFADINEQTKAVLKQNLDVGLVAENPLDAWGTPNNAEQRMVNCLSALANDPAAGLAFFCSNPRDDYWYSSALHRMVEKGHALTKTPLAMVCHSNLSRNLQMAEELADLGIPLISGTREALLAAKHAIGYRKYLDEPQGTLPEVEPALIDTIRTEIQQRSGVISEKEALNLLGIFGIPVVNWQPVSDVEQAIGAAENIGYPVALKTDEAYLHKVDVDGVRLNLHNEAAVKEAYSDIAGRLGSRAIVGPMIESGVELGIGAIVDPVSGPVVVVSAGGTFIEVLDDRQAVAAPFDSYVALKLLQRMRLWPLLQGVRGQRPVNVSEICAVISRFSQFIALFADSIKEMDVNPVIAGPEGCRAVDALMILFDEE